MKDKFLKLDTFSQASAEAAEDWQRRLLAAVRDCVDRPSVDKARKVVLTLEVYPHPSDKDDVIIEPTVTTKTPARKHAAFRAMASRNGQLMLKFEEDSEAA